VTLDENLRVVLSNPAAESMFGYTTAGLRGLRYTCFYRAVPGTPSLDTANPGDPAPSHRRQAHLALSRQCARTGRSFRAKLRSPRFTPTDGVISPRHCAI